MKKTILIILFSVFSTNVFNKAISDNFYFNQSMFYDYVEINEKKNSDHELRLFMDLMAYRESSCNPLSARKDIYFGKYQFSKRALKDLNYRGDLNKFLHNEELQDSAFIGYLTINKYRLRKYIFMYENIYKNNIKITESGLLAAAHLLGSETVKKWLNDDPTGYYYDGLNTHISEYIILFSDFDLSGVEMERTYELK